MTETILQKGREGGDLFVYCHIGSLSERETRDYIGHRLGHVGWTGSPASTERLGRWSASLSTIAMSSRMPRKAEARSIIWPCSMNSKPRGSSIRSVTDQAENFLIAGGNRPPPIRLLDADAFEDFAVVIHLA